MSHFPNLAGAAGFIEFSRTSGTATSLFSTSNIRYLAMSPTADDWFEFQFRVPATGTIAITVPYSMSSSSASGVRLRLDKKILSSGGDPTSALSAGTAFTLTTANATTSALVTSTNSADFAFAVTRHDLVMLRFNRIGSDGADTHAGNFQAMNPLVAF